ncbi:MAG TPA: hypothetical protein VJK02_21935 [Anaerolineales bacterium]|nr:hypothetical protein [Anaerolineales bacterium]
MNWQTGFILGGLLFIVALTVLRSEPRTRRWIILILPLPTAVLLYRWVRYERAWLELGVGAGMAAIAVFSWWRLIGRRLPPPTGSQTRVWTKDDPF